MLLVHEERITKQEKIDELLFAKIDKLRDKMDGDHDIVLSRISGLEKKVWIGMGIIFCLSFVFRTGNIFSNILTPVFPRGYSKGQLDRSTWITLM